MSKFCSKCGTPLSEGARFCPSCGAPVQGEVAVQPAYENNAVPAYGNTPDVVEMQWNGYVEDKTIKAMFFTSKGRLNRKRYIMRSLMLLPVSMIGMLLIYTMVTPLIVIGFLLILSLCIPNVLLAIRRCHDLNRSGYFYLLTAVPIANIIVPLMLLFQKGSTGPNQYGPDPLGN